MEVVLKPTPFNISLTYAAQETYKNTEEFIKNDFAFIVNVIMDGTLCIAGIICNILAFIVIQRDRRKLSMSILLQGLAVSDGLFLVYDLIYTTLRSVYLTTGHLKFIDSASPYIVTFALPIGWLTQTCAVWIVTAVTIDRYAMIAWPFRAQKLCTVKNARIVVVVIFLCSTVYNIPRFFYYYHLSFGEQSSNNGSSSTFVGHSDTKSRSWITYRTVYHVWITWIFVFFIPLPILAILNVRLIKLISVAYKSQEELTGKKCKREFGVTLNLIVVVTVFLVCQAPDFIASVITRDRFNVDKEFISYFLCVKEMLLILNASINFTIYCLFYEKFRKLLKQLCCSVLGRDEYRMVDTGSKSAPETHLHHRKTVKETLV